jgi:hypothetical protein
MAGQWKEVVRLRFKGDRFRDHALDLGALSELSQFQKIIAETSKALWRGANPDRERLPRNFEERTRLCLRRIEDGSATAPLEVYIEEEPQAAMWESEPHEISEAIDLAHEVFEAVERDSPLPERFPKELLAQYADWGKSLAEDEEVEIQRSGKQPTRFTHRTRVLLSDFCDVPKTDFVDVTGEVLEADVKQRRFQLWIDAKSHISVTFSESQEVEVTTALRDHKSVRARVKGHAEMSPQGKLLRVTEIEELVFGPVGEALYDTSAPSIEEVLAGLAREVPQVEWDRLPSDLTDNLDHYIYGTPKR